MAALVYSSNKRRLGAPPARQERDRAFKSPKSECWSESTWSQSADGSSSASSLSSGRSSSSSSALGPGHISPLPSLALPPPTGAKLPQISPLAKPQTPPRDGYDGGSESDSGERCGNTERGEERKLEAIVIPPGPFLGTGETDSPQDRLARIASSGLTPILRGMQGPGGKLAAVDMGAVAAGKKEITAAAALAAQQHEAEGSGGGGGGGGNGGKGRKLAHRILWPASAWASVYDSTGYPPPAPSHSKDEAAEKIDEDDDKHDDEW